MVTYPQFCAIARAAEILGERWTLLILRELWLGPQRFADLKSRLAPVAPGVLNGRLRSLQARGLVQRRKTPPPTPASLYELTDSGRALEPVLMEMLRWGARYLFPERPGERFEPEWFRMVLTAYASEGQNSSAEIGVSVLLPDGSVRPAAFVVAGETGVAVLPYPGGAAAEVAASPVALLGLMSGRLTLDEAAGRGDAVVSGDRRLAALLPALFRMAPTGGKPASASP
jgi:DNA-binding HxlR family transcriptional regulator